MNDVVLNKKLQENPELKKFYFQEKLILEITELISELMLKKNVSEAELAKRLNVSEDYVGEILDGTSTMTIGTLSDIFTVLGSKLVVNEVSQDSHKRKEMNNEK